LPGIGLYNSEGFEPIGVCVTGIPNYTVKNGCFGMCRPVWIENSVTEQ